MQSIGIQTAEGKFLDEVTLELEKMENLLLKRSPKDEKDLVMKNPNNGSEVIIELKNAGRYGELPISTILPIAGLVRSNPRAKEIILVSFSNLPHLLLSKLNELGVKPVTDPTFDKVVRQVQSALVK